MTQINAGTHKHTPVKLIQMLENRIEPLSVKEVARILGESAGNVYRRIQRGEIPGVFRGSKRSLHVCSPIFAEFLKAKIAECHRPKQAVSKPSTNGQIKAVAPSNEVTQEPRRARNENSTEKDSSGAA